MKICLISLGCDKNYADSETMLSLLFSSGHEAVETEEEADVVLINTCCFIHDAKEESIQTILQCADTIQKLSIEKQKKPYLVVCGCLAQRYEKEIAESIPEVDAIVGTTAFADIVSVLTELSQKKTEGPIVCHRSIDYLPMVDVKRGHFSGMAYAYLKIAEGCDKHCTYCIIPSIKGKYRSVPMERLIEEAKALSEAGVKELILVAQETTLYGMDLYKEKMLPKLLHHLCQIDGIEWIRLLYCYPEEITKDLLEVMRDEEKIVNYLDMPIQHASDAILKRMGRKTNQKELREKIAMIRQMIPDMVLRTTLITGFPGETEGDFDELCDFVREILFDRLGVFPYSKEEGTPAAKLRPQISKKEKTYRRNKLMQIQQDIAFSKAKERIGKDLYVMVEGSIPSEEVLVARSYMDAPSVDGYVFVQNSKKELLSGTMLWVHIISAKGYDLIAIPKEER